MQLIDHHKTSLNYNQYDWGNVVVEDDDGKPASATSLFYHYLVNRGHLSKTEALDEFVELIRQYDTWEWEKNNNQQAQRLNALFFLVSIDEFEETMLERLKSFDHFQFDDFEKKILDMEEGKIKRYIRRKRREIVQTQINDHFAGVVYAESYHSELGNELGKEYPHLDYIAIINMGGKRLGFRTIHDHVDVSEIAGQLGGGGHAKAAGCTLTENAYKLYVSNTFQLEPLREDAKNNRYNLKDCSFGTLYLNRREDHFFIRPNTDSEWTIEKNRMQLAQTFPSFTEAEKFLKRTEACWLTDDDHFVNYLKNEVKKRK